jgi:hypothetical protein
VRETAFGFCNLFTTAAILQWSHSMFRRKALKQKGFAFRQNSASKIFGPKARFLQKERKNKQRLVNCSFFSQ